MSRLRSLDAKLCFSEGGPFRRVVLPEGGLAFLRVDVDSPAFREALAKPDSLFSKPLALLKESRSSKVALVSLPPLGKVIVKRHNSKSLRYALRYLFRKARSFRSLQAAWLLEQLGVPTPKTFAALAFRKALLLKSSYLLTEPVDGLLSAPDYLKRLLKDEDSFKRFMNVVMKNLTLMHDNGVSHGDLKFSNIAATASSDGKPFFAGFIDLDSLKRSSWPLSLSARAFELGRMAASFSAISSDLGFCKELPEAAKLTTDAYNDASNCKILVDSVLDNAKIWMTDK